jgi:hypothetical protein
MSKWRSCFSCLGKICGCREKSSKGRGVGDINFSVSSNVNVGVSTQDKIATSNVVLKPVENRWQVENIS